METDAQSGAAGDGAAPDASLSADDCEICHRILSLLRSEDYWESLKAVVFLEAKANSLQIEGFNNFRDTLNHLGFVAQSGRSPEQCDHQMAEAREHLRRAFTHPFQDVIDAQLALLERRLWLYHIRSHFAGSDILSPRERQQQIDAVKQKLIDVRNLKGQNRIVLSARLFRECYDDLQQVRLMTTPSRGLMRTKLAIQGAVILVSVLGGIVIKAVFF